jgi:hypothetical protein
VPRVRDENVRHEATIRLLSRACEAGAGQLERARTELLYGLRLARAGRGGEAADFLTGALKTFERLGAEP